MLNYVNTQHLSVFITLNFNSFLHVLILRASSCSIVKSLPLKHIATLATEYICTAMSLVTCNRPTRLRKMLQKIKILHFPRGNMGYVANFSNLPFRCKRLFSVEFWTIFEILRATSISQSVIYNPFYDSYIYPVCVLNLSWCKI